MKKLVERVKSAAKTTAKGGDSKVAGQAGGRRHRHQRRSREERRPQESCGRGNQAQCTAEGDSSRHQGAWDRDAPGADGGRGAVAAAADANSVAAMLSEAARRGVASAAQPRSR